MAITPMFIEQIEKFQCLKLSTAQGPEHGTLRGHVARVTWQQMCLKVGQLIGPKSLKTLHVWFGDTWSLNLWCLVAKMPWSLSPPLNLCRGSAPMCPPSILFDSVILWLGNNPIQFWERALPLNAYKLVYKESAKILTMEAKTVKTKKKTESGQKLLKSAKSCDYFEPL